MGLAIMAIGITAMLLIAGAYVVQMLAEDDAAERAEEALDEMRKEARQEVLQRGRGKWK